MPDLPLEHPSTPPCWLPHWPAESAIRQMFPENIRQYSFRILSQTLQRYLDWTESTLTLRVGDQQATWRYTHGEWRRTCTCGFSSDRCAHTYAAARLFTDVLRRSQWTANAAGPRPPAGSPVPSTQAADVTPAPHGRDTHPATVPTAADRRLEVEVDFHHEPEHVAIRLYLTEHNRRALLRVQHAYNLGERLRLHEGSRAEWSTEDARFLSWLSPQLRGTSALAQNLQLLTLPQKSFDYWLDHWGDCPGRFLDRASQTPLLASGDQAAMTIELRDQGEWVEIAAVVTVPGGRHVLVHEIFNLLASGRRDVVVDGRLLEFSPPVSWDLIKDVFARKSPRMRREHICEYLPHLLEGRLDIVHGPLVERREEPGAVQVEATADGADILLQARVGDAPVLPDSSTCAGAIRAEGDRFVITTYNAPALPALRRFLRDLKPERTKDGRLRIAGDPDRVTALRRGWEQLPAEVAKRALSPLQDLLGEATALQPELMVLERPGFVDLHLGWACGEARLTEGELRDALARHRSVFRTQEGHWFHIEPERLARVRQQLAQLGFAEGDSQRLFKPEARKVLLSLAAQAPNSIAAPSRSFAETLLREVQPERPGLPASLAPVLREYQKQGFDFLSDRCSYRLGAILADDMGLGKTVQVLALLSAAAQHSPGGRGAAGSTPSRGALVICPASVVSVWIDEARRFCPDLRCVAYTGPAETRAAALQRQDWHVLVANYAIARMDAERLTTHEFEYVILDEAQHIKNPESQIAQTVKRLRTKHALALTGTPLENRLLDLWSIMDFLNPGFLGNQETFLRHYEHPQRHRELARRIAPVVLRRTKEVVAPELPARTEEVLKIELKPTQRELYDAELVRARECLRLKGPIEVLAAITRLRQVACHPELLLKRPTDLGSAKLDALLDLVDELREEGHSLLVFSQFTTMLHVIRRSLGGVPNLMLTGQTPTAERAQLVRQFNDTTSPQVFLLSLKAAGTGLTLTKADYVVIFDPWWNPAVERQAIDRTHRIGQKKPVIAYRLVATNTVEEKVLALQQAKGDIFDEVMGDAERTALPQRLNQADIESLLA